ncbi:hypothetical protein KAW18_01300 [candidate division WOR-3 bacterium]|nr:hypothetical protein [candidate division WOR-3 bacterium]
MSWIDKNKGAGPWDFTERGDVFGYLNNARWSSQQDAIDFCEARGLPLDLPNQHHPCSHWHKEKTSEEIFPAGKWVAAMQQPGTPYIYVYDILQKAVIRVDTSEIPVFVSGRLELDSAYALDYDMGYGNPGAQRGGYCMNKDATRIWYLFTKSDGDRSDAELIEVDISKTVMRKVESTLFPNLVPSDAWPSSNNERINDGCSDDTHTYWCTSLVAGRVIKIRNSDHSIADDHTFNYPIECGPSSFNEPITTIDFDKNTGKLFWTYIRDYICCDPVYNACSHLIRANTDFAADIDEVVCGSGFNTPAWQNMIRIYSNHVLHHRAYHPFFGYFRRRTLDLSGVDIHTINQNHLQNIFGVKDGNVFTLMHGSNLYSEGFLYCINFSDMTEISNLDISYYTGRRYPIGYDWDWTSVSAMNQQTGVIAIFRYHNIEKRNYAGCFSASSGLELLCDVPLHVMRHTNVPVLLSEPQIWTMPG